MEVLAALIGGVIAVGLGYIANVCRDDRLRQKEAKSVEAALYGEILYIQYRLANFAQTLATAHKNGTIDQPSFKQILEHIKLPEAVLFDHLAPKMTVLSGDRVREITQFYTDLRNSRDAFARYFAGRMRDEVTLSVPSVLKPAAKGIDDADKVLRRIETETGKPEHETPDILDALDIIEAEDEAIRRDREVNAMDSEEDHASR